MGRLFHGRTRLQTSPGELLIEGHWIVQAERHGVIVGRQAVRNKQLPLAHSYVAKRVRYLSGI